MEKAEVVRCLRLANQLWAIEGANPYRVRAHDRAADAIEQSPLPLDEILQLSPGDIPGVGRETLAMIRTLIEQGMPGLLRRLDITIPVTSVELLRLPGIGPKTAHRLVHEHGIHSAADLDAALRDGRLRQIPGLGPNRLARLRRELTVFFERQHAVPIAIAWPLAVRLTEHIRSLPGVSRVSVTGPVRRLVTMSPAIDLVAAAEDPAPLFAWAGHPQPNEPCPTLSMQVPAQDHPVPVRIRVTDERRFPLCLMRTTGDATHHEVITGLLRRRGITWTDDDRLLGTAAVIRDETDLYDLVGLPFLPPEIREGRGLLCNPDALVDRSDIRGDLHVHTTWSDGSMSVAEAVQAAEALGYEYIAITDHSQSLAIAGGLDPERVRRQREEIHEVREHSRVRVLHGIEVDILPDGRLDLPDDVLFELDLVIASVHSAMDQSREQMTERILRAIRHPAVHIIGHLTGRILGRRAPYDLDLDRLFDEALVHGVLFELNANPNRLDISEDLLRTAKSRGMLIPVNTDTHHPDEFHHMEYGVRMARRGWLSSGDVLNTLPYDDLVRRLLRRRSRVN
ncbi:PHP domain-containing protein [Alicyclobacillus sp.]|uniref:PHP domain-containing protein n=1 Tax=Alicyclobacillus sp. TaxID=61169 RepID=UPI0025BADE8B|nr:PHP domain-containing protein [Alicyclobacillus sp.]MCL6516767.1 PHP domain-containing protein [Alicyclobacillus sp.]